MRYQCKSIARFLAVLLSLLMLLGVASGCKNNENNVTETKAKSFIWEISSDTTSVYLLGSIHIASQDLYPLDSTIENAFESANNLVVEVNTNNVSQLDTSSFLMKYGTYPTGDGFQKNISENLYDKLKEQFQNFSINIALLDGYRPWVIYNTWSQFLLKSLGYMSEYGIDFYFLDKSQNSSKNVLELETAEYQLALISSIPDEIMIKTMQYDVENPEMEKYLQDLFAAWVGGDAAKMEAITFGILVTNPELVPYYEKMYDQRNYNMAQKIEEYLADDETYFIVVGAGHLVGEKGLINLLKEKGYNIEQLFRAD